jgi:predicted RNase H-like HicB family nuclease
MEITEISAHYNRKVQLDQFEPIQHGVELTAVVEDGEDPETAYDELSERAEEMVENEIARRLTQKKLAEDGDDDSD